MHIQPAQFVRLGAMSLGVAIVAAVALSGSAAFASTQPTVGLGTADSFDVIGATTVTNTGPTVINNGDVGLSPGTSITGFPPAVIAGGVIHATDAQALQAQADVTIAYNDAAGRLPDVSGLSDLTGQTLTAGVYAGPTLSLNGTLTLSGSATDVFIFQAGSTLITGSSAAVAFMGGATACNVFWQVGSSATLGSATSFAGTVLAQASVTADSAATVTGRLFARTGAVTLDSNVISRSADCGPRSAIVGGTPSAAASTAPVPATTPTTTSSATAAATAKASAKAKAKAAAHAAHLKRLAAKKKAAAKDTASSDAAGKTGTGTGKSTIPQLPPTGMDPTPFVAASAALLISGAGLLVVAGWRRRQSRVR